MSAAPQRVAAAPARGPAPRRPHLREVAPAPKRGRAGWVGIAVIMSVMFVVFAAAAVQTLLIQTQVGIDDTQRSLDVARAVEADLLLEVASLEAPARILAEASIKVEMGPPDNRVFLAPIVPGQLDAPLDPPGDDPFPGSDRTTASAAEVGVGTDSP